MEGGDPIEEPGNQMAGYDMRLRSPWKSLPVAFYTQWIGEDEAGGLPSKFIGQFGLEFWGASPLGGYRLRAEYADTACIFTSEDAANSTAPTATTSTRRATPIEAGSSGIPSTTIAACSRWPGCSLAPMATYSASKLRHAQLNRDGSGTHAISDVPSDLDNVELRYSKVFGIGKVSIGLGYDDWSAPRDGASDVRGSLSWQQGF